MPGRDDLSERQRQYLQAIFDQDQDQENERYAKSRWTRSVRPRPSAEGFEARSNSGHEVLYENYAHGRLHASALRMRGNQR